jgi:hypothetical protein
MKVFCILSGRQWIRKGGRSERNAIRSFRQTDRRRRPDGREDEVPMSGRLTPIVLDLFAIATTVRPGVDVRRELERPVGGNRQGPVDASTLCHRFGFESDSLERSSRWGSKGRRRPR